MILLKYYQFNTIFFNLNFNPVNNPSTELSIGDKVWTGKQGAAEDITG